MFTIMYKVVCVYFIRKRNIDIKMTSI